MTTVDQAGHLVLDFYRCAMLPCSTDTGDTGHDDDLSQIGVGSAPAADPTRHWDADAFRRRVPGPHFDADMAGSVLRARRCRHLRPRTRQIDAEHRCYTS